MVDNDNDDSSIITNKNNNAKNPALDHSSPYYLYPVENPDIVLVSPPLSENNYESWSRSMKRALLSKNKIKFINGKITTPDKNDSLFDTWERCNNIVLAWISTTLSPDIAHSIIYIDNVAQFWTDLQHHFSKTDHFILSDLLQHIHFMRQGDKSVTTYFNELKIHWEDLETLRVLPSCTCGAHATIKKQRDMEYVMCFLKGLNENYNTINSQILMIESLPDVLKVFSSILQHERQISSSSFFDNSNILLAQYQHMTSNRFNAKHNKGRGKPSSYTKSPSNSKVCSLCGKTCHIVDTCYFKHGFLPGFRFKYRVGFTNIVATAQ
ncbi:uncharacterized protein LOC127104260 [Lathyrus oleraceus]|uniref:uncharacterized protein LOC127104260 n=1 Tax=Pisum sativum TaxID=3888 RepID=UPI0021CFDBD0|nr:uncharacterized protein LOC127104260 [Pisum sativum]